METLIDVRINKKEEFFSHFSEGRLSRELAHYLLEECYGENVNNKITITFCHNFNLKKREKERIVDMIRAHFGMKVQDEEFYLYRDKGMEFLLFVGGILLLIFYYLFRNIDLVSEIILIIGWLAIWEAVDRFVFNGMEKKMKIKRLKELAKAKILFREVRIEKGKEKE